MIYTPCLSRLSVYDYNKTHPLNCLDCITTLYYMYCLFTLLVYELFRRVCQILLKIIPHVFCFFLLLSQVCWVSI